MATSPTATDVTFRGFSRDAIQFLADLAANNDRAWFQPRKADYERLLKAPMEQLCVALEEQFRARGIPLHADPARSPFRIYRDTRFSKDKSPYKTRPGGELRLGRRRRRGGGRPLAHGGGPRERRLLPPPAGRDLRRRRGLAPGCQRGSTRSGSGSSPTSMAFRLDRRRRRRSSRRSGRSATTASRSSGCRPAIPADHPAADLLRKKNVTFGRRLSDAEATEPAPADVLADAFATGTPLMRYLATIGDDIDLTSPRAPVLTRSLSRPAKHRSMTGP